MPIDRDPTTPNIRTTRLRSISVHEIELTALDARHKDQALGALVDLLVAHRQQITKSIKVAA